MSIPLTVGIAGALLLLAGDARPQTNRPPGDLLSSLSGGDLDVSATELQAKTYDSTWLSVGAAPVAVRRYVIAARKEQATFHVTLVDAVSSQDAHEKWTRFDVARRMSDRTTTAFGSDELKQANGFPPSIVVGRWKETLIAVDAGSQAPEAAWVRLFDAILPVLLPGTPAGDVTRTRTLHQLDALPLWNLDAFRVFPVERLPPFFEGEWEGAAVYASRRVVFVPRGKGSAFYATFALSSAFRPFAGTLRATPDAAAPRIAAPPATYAADQLDVSGRLAVGRWGDALVRIQADGTEPTSDEWRPVLQAVRDVMQSAAGRRPGDLRTVLQRAAEQVRELTLVESSPIKPGTAFSGDNSTDDGMSARYAIGSAGTGARISVNVTIASYASPSQAAAGLRTSGLMRSVSPERTIRSGVTMYSYERYSPGHVLFVVDTRLVEIQPRGGMSAPADRAVIDRLVDALIAALQPDASAATRGRE